MMKPLRVIAAAAVLAAAIAAPTSAADDARVRVLHASPDAPAVDVFLDGSKVDALTKVPFGVISDYLAIPAGSHQVTVYATGTTKDPVIDARLRFDAGTSYTLAATNDVAHIKAQVLVDAPKPTADAAQVRIVHLSADAPAVDVAPDGAKPADALVKNLKYPDATHYLTLPGGSYDLEVRPTGTTDVALQLEPIEVEAGTAYSVFAIGSAADPAVGGHGLRAVVARDAMVMRASDTAEASVAPAAPASPASPVALFAVSLAGTAGLAIAWDRLRGTR